MSISTQTSNANGTVILNEMPGSEIYNSTTRISRVPTLDGNASLVHSGFSSGDMTLRISARLSKTNEEILKDIHEGQTIVTVSTKEACYNGALSNLTKLYGMINLSIMLKSKLSA